MKRLAGLLTGLLLLSLALSAGAEPRYSGEIWLEVDAETARLTVYQGHRPVQVFERISVGRAGTAPFRYRGSNRTPSGEFRINRISHDSRFHIFLGLDYPTPRHAREALESGLFDEDDYRAYHEHLRHHRTPPQDTVLGGHIGIHGIGDGDPEIHDQFHWTQGCVAVTNEEIEALVEWVNIGTRVLIR
ncbi:L,D-transpeptidase family protein [Alkalilimnicola ehrlichii]|uniref:L,D-transpeptidase family protein n=1 Tax=Alkalilimnicola ehrlichii TaxID=351052 RepID=UPI003BA0B5D8